MIGLVIIGAAIAGAAIAGGVAGYMASQSADVSIPETADQVTEASDSPISFRKESTVSRELIGAVGLTGQVTYLGSDLSTEENEIITVTQNGADEAAFSFPAPSFVTNVLPAIVKSFRVYADEVYYRYAADDGPIIDNLKDWDSIQKNGEKKLKLANNFMVGKTQKGLSTQLEDLGNFWWQWTRLKPHTYQVIVSGAWYELDPADVFSFAYSSEAENINSVVEVVGVAVNDSQFPSTEITLQELEENPKTDRSIKQRIRNKGSVNRSSRSSVNKIVAAAGYPGRADYYCTGTNDHSTLQEVIDSLKSSGGTISLTAGVYDIADKVIVEDKVSIVGQGDSTVLSLTEVEPGTLSSADAVSFYFTGLKASMSKVLITGEMSYATLSSPFNDNPGEGERPKIRDIVFSGCTKDSGGVLNLVYQLDGENILVSGVSHTYTTSGQQLATGFFRGVWLNCNIYDFTIDNALSSLTGYNVGTLTNSEAIFDGDGVTLEKIYGCSSLFNATSVSITGATFGYIVNTPPNPKKGRATYTVASCSASGCYTGYSGYLNKTTNSEASDCKYGFSSDNVTNSTAFGCDDGFINVNGLTGCTAEDCNRGFYGCSSMQQNNTSGNTTNYTNCYADSGTSNPVADTAAGGYNS